MHRRKRDAKTKAILVIEGLTGKLVAEICSEHQIQYYRWRDQFLAHTAKAFAGHPHMQKEARLEQENARLQKLVGEFTRE